MIRERSLEHTHTDARAVVDDLAHLHGVAGLDHPVIDPRFGLLRLGVGLAQFGGGDVLLEQRNLRLLAALGLHERSRWVGLDQAGHVARRGIAPDRLAVGADDLPRVVAPLDQFRDRGGAEAEGLVVNRQDDLADLRCAHVHVPGRQPDVGGGLVLGLVRAVGRDRAGH